MPVFKMRRVSALDLPRDEMHHHYLCALLMPNNITSDLTAIQHALWSTHAPAITRVFPPVLPLCWVTALPTVEQLRTLKVSYRHPLVLHHWQWHQGALVLATAAHPLFREIRRCCKSVMASHPALPWPLGRGVLITTRTPNSNDRLELPAPPIHRSVRAVRVVFFSLYCDTARWWLELGWSEVYSRWIKTAQQRPARRRCANSDRGHGARTRRTLASERDNRPVRVD